MSRATNVELEVKGMEREEDMKRNWNGALQGLVGLRDGVGSTLAKLERGRDVVVYLGEGR